MEPRLTLLFDSDSLDDLWNELDTLQALMDKAISDAEGVNDSISAQMNGITDSADEVKAAASDLSDALTDWTDENIETVNDVSARISWTMDRLEPIADSVDAALDRIQESADLAGEALDEIDEIGDLSEDALDDLRQALDRMHSSAGHASDAVDQLKNALDQLRDALGDSGAMSAAMEVVRDALDNLTAAFGALSASFDDLWEAVGNLHSPNGGNSGSDSDSGQNGEDSSQEGTDNTQTEEGEGSSDTGGEAVDGGDSTDVPETQPPAGDGNDLDWTDVLAALDEMSNAAAQIQAAIGSLNSALHGVGNAANDVLQETLNNIAAAAGSLDSSFQMLDKAASHMEDSLDHLDDAAPYGERASALLKEAAEALDDACGQLRDAGNTFSNVMSELADKPEISFSPVGEAISEKGDVLDNAMSSLSDSMQSLNNTMSASSDLLLADMRAINNQFGKVIDVLRRHTDSEKEEEDEDKELLEDVSDQASETDENAGRIINAQNQGTVEGDVNVAGIVGSMAIEYDYDPEDDLTTSGDRSLNFRYQAAALTEACVNNGTVTGKKDYVGGIVGRMDLGTVSQCESYAQVESSGGDYVGGIAGAAWSTIRSCWSRCALAGDDYIGGVAGLGKNVTDCRSLVEINEGSAYLGAVLGSMEEGGEVTGNLFTHSTLNGINGVSYLGQAEPVDFETLSQNAPYPFTRFRLVFTADGQVVDTFDFSYGDALTQLPDIPEKEGYSASWPDIDYDFLTFPQTLEAEYTAYSAALTALGDPPKIVTEGTFSSGSIVSASSNEETWMDPHGVSHTGAVYTVTVTDPIQSVTAFHVQYKLSDDAVDGTVWVKTDENWEQRDAVRDGTYLVFQVDGDSVIFTVQEQTAVPVIWILAISGGVAAAGILVLLWRKRRTKTKAQAKR